MPDCNCPIAESRKEQIVERGEFFFVKGMAAVQDDVAAGGERARADQRGRVLFARIVFAAESQIVGGPR